LGRAPYAIHTPALPFIRADDGAGPDGLRLRSSLDIRSDTPLRSLVGRPQEVRESQSKSEILQGTLDLMVLKTLDAMGPLHGYGIAMRLEQISREILRFNQGTVYASLLRLVQKRWITAAWGTSDNNRRAKFYTITAAGRRRLAAEADEWRRVSGVISRLLAIRPGTAVPC
jgi:PadR family transcriptional regulator PadR